MGSGRPEFRIEPRIGKHAQIDPGTLPHAPALSTQSRQHAAAGDGQMAGTEHAEPSRVPQEALEKQQQQVNSSVLILDGANGADDSRTREELEWVDDRYVASNKKPRTQPPTPKK